MTGCKYDGGGRSSSSINNNVSYNRRKYKICLGCTGNDGKAVDRVPIDVCEVAFRLTYCISRRTLMKIHSNLKSVCFFLIIL